MSKGTAVLGLILAFAGGYFVGAYTKKGGDGEGTAEMAATGSESQRVRVPVGLSPNRGPKDAKVTIVEFSDFQCPFCSKVGDTVKDIEKEFPGQVRIVFKHNPLPMHQDAPLAAEASMAANEQGKFWEMHDKMFQNQKALKRPDLEKYAQQIGLNVDQFKKSMDDHKFQRQIDADKSLATQVGAKGTPSFYINGRPLTGAPKKDDFAKIVREEITYAEGLIKAGTAPSRLYSEIMKNAGAAPGGQKPDRGAQAAGGRAVDGELYKVPVGNSPFKGVKDAKVTIVEFSDFQCPFCGRVNPTVKQILDTYKKEVKFVFKNNALPFHQNAKGAAQAGLAANRQGKFWEMHDKMFENQKALDAESLKKFAKEIGLNVSKFEKDMNDPAIVKQVDEETALANKLGARGTPAFFVNGRYMRGAAPFEKFKTVIDAQIIAADAAMKKGATLATVYDELIKTGQTEAKAGAPQEAGARPGQPDPNSRYRVDITGAPFKGAKDAKVTVVEYSDFQCPFCSRVGPTLKQIVETWPKEVKVVFLQNPLPFHKDAMPAAAASLAAHRQGKFWPMHDKLFENQKALDADSLKKYAKELGLNMSKFESDMNDPKLKTEIEAQQKGGAKVGARGTPAFFVNGKFLSGAQPFEAFKTRIEEELKVADDLVKKGTPVTKVYETIMKDAKTEVAAGAAPTPGGTPGAEKKALVPLSAGSSPSKGGKGAPVLIVEFSDFQCPFCSRVGPTLKQIEETYGNKVQIVFKHFPLPFHKEAPLAAEAAVAAHEQGKFWEMHDKMFENQKALKREDLEKYAQELGLNMPKFKSALDTGRAKKAVDSDVQLANQASGGKMGTPSFYINGRMLSGAQPFPAFKAVIDEELKKKGI